MARRHRNCPRCAWDCHADPAAARQAVAEAARSHIAGDARPRFVVTKVRPTYTFEALRARIQGSVLLELIVRSDGLPDEIRVIGSLDPGLDEEAMAAARPWRFQPGRVGDAPVDVLVTIVMDFRVH